MQTREMLGLHMARLYQKKRKRSEEIVGEVEMLAIETDKRKDDWLNREAPILATMQHGYCVGPIEEARDQVVRLLPHVKCEWEASADLD
jgi:hypothetical protein